MSLLFSSQGKQDKICGVMMLGAGLVEKYIFSFSQNVYVQWRECVLLITRWQ